MGNDDQAHQHYFSMVESWKQSGLSQKAYCEQNTIRYHVFHYWYKVYKGKQYSSTGTFVPLKVSPLLCGNLELHLNDGRRIVFHQPVSVEYLKALIV